MSPDITRSVHGKVQSRSCWESSVRFKERCVAIPSSSSCDRCLLSFCVSSAFEKEETCKVQDMSVARENLRLLLCRVADLRKERGGGEMRTCPPGSLATQWGWCIYLLSPFLQAARTAAISFCTQEVYLVVGFLSFPVSFLHEDISVFSGQQLIRRMLSFEWRRTNIFPVSDPDPFKGTEHWAWVWKPKNLTGTPPSLVPSSSPYGVQHSHPPLLSKLTLFRGSVPPYRSRAGGTVFGTAGELPCRANTRRQLWV